MSLAALRSQLVARPWLGGVLLAIGVLVFTAIVAHHIGLPIRDPDGTLGARMVFPFMVLMLFLAGDVAVRVFLGARGTGGSGWRDSATRVARQRWSLPKVGIVLIGFLSFQVVYLCYRNLKSFLPIVTDANWDAFLWRLDRDLLLGHTPAQLLHGLLGTGVAAHLLSSVYLLFLLFVPVSVAASLMWTTDVREGFWYVTAASVNWVLGTASYYLLPSLGPVFYRTGVFDELPTTGVAQLQGWLIDHRSLVIADPLGSGDVQSIAAFASLHISVVFTAFLIARRFGRRRLAMALTAFLVLTALATVYFGWHYLLDDLAGFLIGWLSVVIAAPLTGHRWRHPAAPAAG